MRILIAEDDEPSRIFLQRVREKAGYEARAAENGIRALEMFEDADFEEAAISFSSGDRIFSIPMEEWTRRTIALRPMEWIAWERPLSPTSARISPESQKAFWTMA